MERRFKFGDKVEHEDRVGIVLGIDYSEKLHGGHYYALVQYPESTHASTWDHPESEFVTENLLNVVTALGCTQRLQWVCTEYLRLSYAHRG